jgi:DNA-binding HxlR family transcriptional regulator
MRMRGRSFGASDFEASYRFGIRSAILTMMTAIPTLGRPVRGSTSGRPIMAAFDLLGRRWALRILWELRDGPVGFRDLRQRCDGMSSSVLRDRLAELTAAGLVAKDDADRHALTPIGQELGPAFGPLNRWAERWARTTTHPGGVGS